jgi:hypothetical protein
MRRKIASSDDGCKYMTGDLRRKATALPRKSYQETIEHNNGWVCGSVTKQVKQSGTLFGTKALAKEVARWTEGREHTD